MNNNDTESSIMLPANIPVVFSDEGEDTNISGLENDNNKITMVGGLEVERVEYDEGWKQIYAKIMIHDSDTYLYTREPCGDKELHTTYIFVDSFYKPQYLGRLAGETKVPPQNADEIFKEFDEIPVESDVPWNPDNYRLIEVRKHEWIYNILETIERGKDYDRIKKYRFIDKGLRPYDYLPGMK